MTNFRLLKRTRQTTEYSCGASALQSVLAWWGKDVDERELMTLMGTSEEEGTYPERIAQAARALGFDAEVKQNLASSGTAIPVELWTDLKVAGIIPENAPMRQAA